MAGQNQVFKLATLFSNCRIVLTNRPLVLSCQPSYGIKRSTKEKIQELNIPDKPKRPATPYIRYYGEQYPIIQQQEPNMKIQDIVKKVSTAWKEVPADVKAKYEQLYKQEVATFNEQLKIFNNSLTLEQKEALSQLTKEKSRDKKRRTIRKLHRETNKPKRPMNSYMLFLADYLKKRNKTMKEGLMDAITTWKQLSENEKQVYQDQYLALKKIYEEDMKDWQKQMAQGKEAPAPKKKTTSTKSKIK